MESALKSWKRRHREFKFQYIRDRDSTSVFGNRACLACKERIQSSCPTCSSRGVVCKQVGVVNMGRFKEPVMTISNQTTTGLLVAKQDALETRDEYDHEVEAIVESRGSAKSKEHRIKWMGYPLNTSHYPQCMTSRQESACALWHSKNSTLTKTRPNVAKNKSKDFI